MVVSISGMHCAACEVLIERKFRKVPGVTYAQASQSTGQVVVECDESVRAKDLHLAIRDDGYRVTESQVQPDERNTKKDYLQLSAVFLIIMALYVVLKQFHLIPENFGVSENMGYGVVFVIGLVAAVSTCMAVSGGLLLAVAAKYNEHHPELTGKQRFKPHLYFNVGRVVSYTLLGGAVGALGSVLSLSTRLNGIVVVGVSLVMVLMGIQLLKIFPWLSRFQPRMPKFIAHRIYRATEGRQTKIAPFLFGAATFFLPCGFTQALQLYVLTKGSFLTGALTMLVFSLGTLPALMSVSAIMSFARGNFQRYFIKFAGVLVVLMGIFNISNGLALAGINVKGRSNQSVAAVDTNISDPNVQLVNGVQIVKMAVVGYEYKPSHFTVTAGIPVEWQIDGSRAAGCAQVITMPGAKVTEFLSKTGIKTIRFTPTTTGTLAFSCTMGMTTPGAAFTVVKGSGTKALQPAQEPDRTNPSSASGCDPTVMMCDPDLISPNNKLQ